MVDIEKCADGNDFLNCKFINPQHQPAHAWIVGVKMLTYQAFWNIMENLFEFSDVSRLDHNLNAIEPLIPVHSPNNERNTE